MAAMEVITRVFEGEKRTEHGFRTYIDGESTKLEALMVDSHGNDSLQERKGPHDLESNSSKHRPSDHLMILVLSFGIS